MRVAIYARVSTDAQEARGTIGSQLELLRERVAREGHELVAEYTDDGLSGARLDRPGLDALRDAAEAGHIEGAWCLSADRLARMYAYQVIVLDELSRHGVPVWFHDTPRMDDNPQARLLTQVQGVIAEYERAKIAERNRRGKLWRARAGEIVAWKPPYGFRRIPRAGETPAHLEVFEREASVVRRIFDDYVRKDISMRQIAKGLYRDGILSPGGRAVWSVSTIGRILRNEAYIGRVYYNRTKVVPQRKRTGKTRQVRRPRDQWIAITVPAILDEDLFEAAQRVSRDNAQWNPRRADPGHWLLRGLVRCGHCDTSVSCHTMRGGKGGTLLRYYYCRNHDPLRAGGEHRRCPGRNIRADELDTFVFEQVRDTLLRPDVLLAGEHAVSAHRPPADDELLRAQLARLQRKVDAVAGERRRLADLYQADFIGREEMVRRGDELRRRKQSLEEQQDALVAQHKELARQNNLRKRIAGFAAQVVANIERLDFAQRQRLLRLVVEKVLVRGWQVEIMLRIPLDEPPASPERKVSSKDRLRSVDLDDRRNMRAIRHVRLAAARTDARVLGHVVNFFLLFETGARGAAMAFRPRLLAARAIGRRLLLLLAPAAIDRLRQLRPGRTGGLEFRLQFLDPRCLRFPVLLKLTDPGAKRAHFAAQGHERIVLAMVNARRIQQTLKTLHLALEFHRLLRGPAKRAKLVSRRFQFGLVRLENRAQGTQTGSGVDLPDPQRVATRLRRRGTRTFLLVTGPPEGRRRRVIQRGFTTTVNPRGTEVGKLETLIVRNVHDAT